MVAATNTALMELSWATTLEWEIPIAKLRSVDTGDKGIVSSADCPLEAHTSC